MKFIARSRFDSYHQIAANVIFCNIMHGLSIFILFKICEQMHRSNIIFPRFYNTLSIRFYSRVVGSKSQFFELNIRSFKRNNLQMPHFRFRLGKYWRDYKKKNKMSKIDYKSKGSNCSYLSSETKKDGIEQSDTEQNGAEQNRTEWSITEQNMYVYADVVFSNRSKCKFIRNSHPKLRYSPI
ncbi:hypothetical protein EPI10_006195 [Gossypium australe]|uniref:Uncharacterized protein n=1 Tax=Gossypium australe TaxID=47621 RepID=A0A5B6WT58_9ROSI|nr:hypothetical protein EPI10_006195 [Gossypium australe]